MRWTLKTADMKNVLELKNVKVNFNTTDGDVAAVRGANITVKAGETIAIVGESGSGKSQLMMGAMGLLAANGMAEGEALFGNQNLIGMSKDQLNSIRGSKITMIFQEPMTSLDPLYTIGNQLIEPIKRHSNLDHIAARNRALEMLELVKIKEPERRMRSIRMKCPAGNANV